MAQIKSGVLDNPAHRTIIYIVGCGHSGSTLLDMILDSRDELSGLGELYLFQDYLTKNRPDNHLKGSPCACGQANFKFCRVWSKFLNDLVVSGLTPEKFVSRVSRLEAITLFFGHKGRHLDQEEKFLDVLFSNRGTSILVDSSKTPLRLIRLARLKFCNIKVIHLTKDVRSYANSMKRIGFSTPRAFWLWSVVNLFVLFLRRFDPKIKRLSWYQLGYECYVRNPKREIEQLCNFLGVPFREDMLNYFNRTHHTLGGNPMRMDPKPIRSPGSSAYILKSPVSKFIFQVFLNPLNRRLAWGRHARQG